VNTSTIARKTGTGHGRVEEGGRQNDAMLSQEKTLRVGIVGAGHMGAVHARHWARVPGAQIVAFADARTAKGDALAARYPGAAVHSTVKALLGAGVDAVSVCVPTAGHLAVVLETLGAGVPTFCEKPMALSLEDCDAMIAARDAAGVPLTVGHVARFFPEFANAKRLIDSGAVGAPAAARVRRGGDFPLSDTDWFADTTQSGGVIFDLMVHDLDWLQWCFGPITRVYARSLTERLAGRGLDHIDYALLTMRHANGVISHAEGTWADPGGFVTTFDIAGDGGVLAHDSRRAAPLVKSLRSAESGRPGVTLPSSPMAPDDDPYFREISAFAKSVRDRVPVAITAEEARSAIAVALAAQESVRTGRAVELTHE
jgi:UDP-N-acetylglucosamine 3-dehydrogenase